MDDKTKTFLDERPTVRNLITTALPKIHPAALKHEYLSSVANVIRHTEARGASRRTGNVYRIGFGDFYRQMPLVIIEDRNGTIFHAHTPDMGNRAEEIMVERLQRIDDEWCRDHQTTREPNLITQLRIAASRGNGRDRTNHHGIGPYKTIDPFTYDEKRAFDNGLWYVTDYMSPADEINSGSVNDSTTIHVDDENHYHHRMIELNIATSIDLNLEANDDVDRVDVTLDNKPGQTTNVSIATITPHRRASSRTAKTAGLDLDFEL